jgi:hypothetical protein
MAAFSITTQIERWQTGTLYHAASQSTGTRKQQGAQLMGGPIVRTGTTPKFWENWDNIFGDKAGADKKKAGGTKKKAAKKKTAAKKQTAPKAAKPAKKSAKKAAKAKKTKK